MWLLDCAEQYHYWGLCRVLLLLVTGDCAEHSYYDWGLETVQSHPYCYWLLETVQSTPIMTVVTRLCRAVPLLGTVQSPAPIITGY